MEIKKILYATDLSENCPARCYKALEFAAKLGAKVVILHVLEQLPQTTASIMQWFADGENVIRNYEEKGKVYAKERINDAIKTFCAENSAKYPDCINLVDRIEVVVGYAADEILQKLNEYSCDALIMGTHSKGIITNTFLGSTVERVLRRVRKPAFVFPEG
jgi:nucleotide-binding universal stress UspA family protein